MYVSAKQIIENENEIGKRNSLKVHCFNINAHCYLMAVMEISLYRSDAAVQRALQNSEWEREASRCRWNEEPYMHTCMTVNHISIGLCEVEWCRKKSTFECLLPHSWGRLQVKGWSILDVIQLHFPSTGGKVHSAINSEKLNSVLCLWFCGRERGGV